MAEKILSEKELLALRAQAAKDRLRKQKDDGKVREMPVFGLQSTAADMDTTGKSASGALPSQTSQADKIMRTMPAVEQLS